MMRWSFVPEKTGKGGQAGDYDCYGSHNVSTTCLVEDIVCKPLQVGFGGTYQRIAQ